MIYRQQEADAIRTVIMTHQKDREKSRIGFYLINTSRLRKAGIVRMY